MLHVLKREFIDAFKSVRSILILLFITFISYQSAAFFDKNPSIMNELIEGGVSDRSVYTAAIGLIVLVFGFLFVFAISHDVINRELEMKTMRLLVTKTSRFQIVLGKFLGVMLFWVVAISISFMILSIIAGSWFLKDYFLSVVVLFHIIGFVFLISTLISKTKLTMFVGVFLGIILPIIGLVAPFSEKWYLMPFKYILPYNYVNGSAGMMMVPLAIGLIYLSLSIFLLNRKDL